MKETRPEHVALQLDTLWAHLPGQDIAAILRAAREAGVKHTFIEDESSRSVTQIPETKRFLESLRW